MTVEKNVGLRNNNRMSIMTYFSMLSFCTKPIQIDSFFFVDFERTTLADKQNKWREKKKKIYSIRLIWAALKFWINEFRNSSVMERNANSAKSVFVIEKKKNRCDLRSSGCFSRACKKNPKKKNVRLFTVDYRILCVFIVVSLLHQRQSQIKMNGTLDGFESYSKTKQSNEEAKQRRKVKSFCFSFGLARSHFRLGINTDFRAWNTILCDGMNTQYFHFEHFLFAFAEHW